MTATSVEDLISQVRRVRENPTLPYEASRDMSLEDIQQSLVDTRAALVAAIEAAPESAFTEQAPGANDEDVWSVGQIVGHCNSALLSIAGGALELMEVHLGEPPEALVAASEVKLMSRSEARDAAGTVTYDDFFTRLPANANLDATATHDFFGPMSARAWLYFIAMHEADHIAQIRAFG